ncbi:unnamed protein product [Caenorhabditis bovis]|uniref:Protein Red n=1 Tax=Caenorhabditis bovis TaxID=2654633 RepID=A0A8S1ES71_9PELO|nr:unnamed protein product [Caenorhabditis bovis]
MAETQTNLRNDDFRKLLTSARSSRPAESTFAQPKAPAASFRHKQQKFNKYKKSAQKSSAGPPKPKKEGKTEDEGEEEKLKNILKNYRDRAAERRKQSDAPEDPTKLTAAYRAVPGDARTARDQADLRKQAILESKYLGGDIEHTHLVKGLDYSLLNKVRSEITKTVEDEDDIDAAYEEGNSKAAAAISTELAQSNSENRMVRAMHRILFKNELPIRNELFAKGRMAYVVELEDEDADIPTTLLRSLHDCPRPESQQSIQANNLIISKLTQVLAYLRTDVRKKKKENEPRREDEKKSSNEKSSSKPKGDSIYDDLDDYVPNRRHRSRERDRDRRDRRDRDRDRERDRDRDRRDYFDRERRREEREKRDERDDRRRESDKERRERQKLREAEELERKEREEKEREKKLEEKLEKRRKETESAGYDECYPGGMAELGGGWDSDEEDFSKMDLGTKKGVVNRWDFDNEEEYAKYQEGREALPKAAYQYGLKAGEGRKTRKSQAANEAKKLDRELNQINKIMEKRKAAENGDGEYKKPKY